MGGPEDDFGDGWAKLENMSKSLLQDIDDKGVPRVEKNLNQLLLSTQRLEARHPKDAHSRSEHNAQMALATQGVDITRQSRALQKISQKLVLPYSSLEPLASQDLDRFLEHKHMMLMASVIEESTTLTENSFRTHYVNKLEEDWTKAKKEILENWGFSVPQTNNVQPQMNMLPDYTAQQTHAQQYNRGRIPKMHPREQSYVKVVAEMHINQQGHASFGQTPVQMFKQVATDAAEGTPLGSQDRQIKDCWFLLCSIIFDGDQSKPVQQNIDAHVRGAIKHLEKQFFEQIQHYVNQRNPAGHMSSSLPLGYVRDFLRQTQQQNASERLELTHGLPTWEQIFLCFRCGQREAALEAAHDAKKDNKVTEEFVHVLKFACGHAMSSDDNNAKKALEREYRAKGKWDKFKVAMYVILLGKGDNADNQQVISTVEDYMWFNLKAIASSPKQHSNELLQNLQMNLRDWGEAHFKEPLVYFKVLLLSLQFSRAIESLRRHAEYVAEAVHVAVCLDYYRVLAVAERADAELIDNDQLNLKKLVEMYIKRFKKTHPEEAFYYLFCLNRNRPQLCREAVAQLLLDTQEWRVLIGDTWQGLGGAKKGCIYNHFDDHDAQNIIIAAADSDELTALHKIELFELADRYSEVFRLLVEELSQRVKVPNNAQGRNERAELLTIGHRMLRQHKPRVDAQAHAQHMSMDPSFASVAVEEFHSLSVVEMLLHYCSAADLFAKGPDYYKDVEKIVHERRLLPYTDAGREIKDRRFKGIRAEPVQIIAGMMRQILSERLNAIKERNTYNQTHNWSHEQEHLAVDIEYLGSLERMWD
mmetsp:Transcript_771/g.1462  ORF Transcript_771/g.1462 Transcript_771/m.1462 type:complete len:814 (+) Transcript_771:35-2476(+)